MALLRVGFTFPLFHIFTSRHLDTSTLLTTEKAEKAEEKERKALVPAMIDPNSMDSIFQDSYVEVYQEAKLFSC